MDRTGRVIGTLITMVVFVALSWLFLRGYFGSLYAVIIAPLFWMLIAVYAHFFIFDNKNHIFEYKNYLVVLLVTSGLIYIVTYFLLGLLISGFAHNAYDTSVSGIIHNFWTIGIVMLAGEIIRSSLINASTRINDTVMNVIVVTVFVGISINYLSLGSQFSDIFGIFKFLGATFVPLAILNVLVTVTARYGGPVPGMMYQLIIFLALWSAPILPDHKWIVASLVASLIPFLTLVVFDNQIKVREFHFSHNLLAETDSKTWIFKFIVIGVVLLFFLGITPIYPINIITNSMYPEINIGDVVLVQKCKIETIKTGEVIQYQNDAYTVIHRVVKITEKDGIIYLHTKGDNNRDIDIKVTTYKNLLGKVVLTVPKAGLPNVWLKKALGQVDESRATGN